jgi:RNA polymerase sigma-70 factor (ECF subfamily)
MPPSDADRSPSLPGSSLLLGLQERAPDAWQRFLRLYGPLVYSWCRGRWQLEPADAADIMQDVVTRVLEAIVDYRGGNFVAWLDRITQSRVANHFRKDPARAAGGSAAQDLLGEVPDQPEEAPSGSDSSDWKRLGGVLARAVEQVRAHSADRSWRAFWQVTVRGRSAADVGLDLGMSVNAVYIANSRILRRLRDELGEGERGPTP